MKKMLIAVSNETALLFKRIQKQYEITENKKYNQDDAFEKIIADYSEDILIE